MSKPYPLYEVLLERVNNRELKDIDIKRVCSTINSIANNHSKEDANDHYREIAALVLHYELVNNDGVLLSSVPYDGKTVAGGKGIIFNMMNLPPLLQQIIAEYVMNPNV